MPYIVRDYSTDTAKWVYWRVQHLYTAYQEYPTENVPAIDSLSGRLDVVSTIDSTSGGATAAIPEASMWILDGLDLIPEYIVNGHTGLWALNIRKQELLIVGIESDGIDAAVDTQTILSPSTNADGEIIFVPNLDQSVRAFEDEGDVSFRTSNEYLIDEIVENIPQTAALPQEFTDIVPGDVAMPDRFWLKIGDDIIIR